ncbi:hypothetical protein DFQ28_007994 [Apophysomyces sp. BC1034]|nr:hypothetical protein DFQ30_007287 [Apophysomyces sp. BC1015]KAG0182076.1 hypothetical protein DFQ29_005917 [Apophysomyces sp. BC1021]KAG0192750.1 hypothetical protein DFQ28_007994 [Apophysomyces sp. BC1034]
MAEAFHRLLAATSEELHLLTAVEIINSEANREQQQDDHDELVKSALRFLRIRAAKGNIEAKIKLSTILDRDTTTIKADKREAMLWARGVFDRRLSSALAPCVSELMNDDPASLVDLVLEKAAKGQQDMCHLAGILLIEGIGLDRNIGGGIDYLQRAAQDGHDDAGIELASILGDAFKYPDVHNAEKSLKLYENVVDNIKQKMSKAHARALTDLARMHYEGQTVPRNVEKAYQLARRVAESDGEQYCQYIVGDVLLHPPSDTIPADARQAVFWLTQSGEQGFPLAIETLSRLHFEGHKGIKRDYEQAHYWCMKGDDIWPSGLGYCQTSLGDMYRAGLGVPKDLIRSFEYYQKAASQQDAPQNYARFMLGEMFFKGEGWQQNYAVAEEYYKLAANENYAPARQRLEELAALEEARLVAERAAHEAALAQKRKTWRIWSFFGSRRRAAV